MEEVLKLSCPCKWMSSAQTSALILEQMFGLQSFLCCSQTSCMLLRHGLETVWYRNTIGTNWWISVALAILTAIFWSCRRSVSRLMSVQMDFLLLWTPAQAALGYNDPAGPKQTTHSPQHGPSQEDVHPRVQDLIPGCHPQTQQQQLLRLQVWIGIASVELPHWHGDVNLSKGTWENHNNKNIDYNSCCCLPLKCHHPRLPLGKRSIFSSKC